MAGFIVDLSEKGDGPGFVVDLDDESRDLLLKVGFEDDGGVARGFTVEPEGFRMVFSDSSEDELSPRAHLDLPEVGFSVADALPDTAASGAQSGAKTTARSLAISGVGFQVDTGSASHAPWPNDHGGLFHKRLRDA